MNEKTGSLSPKERMRHELTLLIRSGYPYLFLVSYEDERLINVISNIGQDLKRDIFIWSNTSGLFRTNQPIPYLAQSQSLNQGLADIDRYNKPALLIVLDGHHHLDSHEVIRMLRNFSDNFTRSEKTIIFVGTQEKIPTDLSREIPSFYFPLPDQAELMSTLDEVAPQIGTIDRSVISQSALGLTVREAARSFKRALIEDHTFAKKDLRWIRAEKAHLIKKNSALSFLSTEAKVSDVGGLDLLKEWLIRRGKGFSTQAKEFGILPPKGVLLLGVQGCGKSLCCKMVASEWNLPLLRLDMGGIYDSYIGASEANIRTALATAEAVAPCVLWIDELEKGLAGLSSSDASDAGTTSRVFSTVLSWLQEKNIPVFVAATANRVEGLPPELLRRGRFDEIFFVNLPNAKERKEIFAIHLQSRGQHNSNFNIDAHAENTTGYSGAEVEQIIIDALYDAFANGQLLSDAHIAKAIKDTIPLSKTLAEDIQKLQRWAYDRARPASSTS
jgi:SpoVK/Ycf46/Vps4 family AAA+-type ATPase